EWEGHLFVVAGGNAPFVRSWDVATRGSAHEFAAVGGDAVSSLIGCELDGASVLAAGTSSGAILVWEPGRSDPLRHYRGVHRGETRVAALSLGEAVVLASGGRDGWLCLWSGDLARTELVVPIGESIRGIGQLESGDIGVATLRGMVTISVSWAGERTPS